MKTFTLFLLLSIPTLLLASFNSRGWTKEDILRPGVEEKDTELLPEDFEAAEATEDVDLAAFGILTRGDPTANAGRFEGDIAGLDSDSLPEYVKNSNDRRKNAVRNSWRRWPKGEIPYVLSSRYGSYSRRTIAKAMEEYHKKTCVKFVPRDRSEHRDYIYIHPDDGCYSLVGRTGGRQALSLDAGCIQTGTIIHELMHTVGFFHEQSRNDRDRWIEILWGNVLSEAEDQFEKYSLRQITHLNEPYDYSSIMHYGPYAFTRNGRRTIQAKRDGGERMGQREGFSETDLRKINKMYHCEDNSGETTRAPTTRKPTTRTSISGSECKDYNWRCRFWTLKIIDYCSKYEKVREELCPLSCGTCSPSSNTATTTTRRPTTTRRTTTPSPSSNCKDKNPACDRWAGKGYCTKTGYSRFMYKTCKQSCGVCSSSDRGRESGRKESRGGEDDCSDDPSFMCRLSRQLLACSSRRQRQVMEKHCPKTCGFC